MDTTPVARSDARLSRARSLRVRHACDACGQGFILHCSVTASAATVSVKVPCMGDACGAEVELTLPVGAFALWTEED